MDINARASKISKGVPESLGNKPPSNNPEHDIALISPPIRIERSFLYNDNVGTQPWQYSKGEHGTHVAHLIRALDPRYDLMVARVGDQQTEISSANLAAVSNHEDNVIELANTFIRLSTGLEVET